MKWELSRRKINLYNNLPEDIDRKILNELYSLYRPRFIGYIQKRYQLSDETAADIYHDSFMLMINNIQTGKYQKQDASLFTYLLGIAKNLILKRFRIECKQPDIAEWIREQLPDTDWNKAQDEANRLLKENNTVCHQILHLFYWERMSLSEIARKLGYQSAEVAKSKKSSCMRRFSFELKRRLEQLDIHFKFKKR